MHNLHGRLHHRLSLWFLGLAFFFMLSLAGTPIISAWIPIEYYWTPQRDQLIVETRSELARLGILQLADDQTVHDLLTYQRKTGLSLGQILHDGEWAERLGFTSDTYKATWYMSNPFDVLPQDIQAAIKRKEIPFHSRTHVWEWCRMNKVPRRWRKSLYAALIETTPINLWRASRGQRPYAKNGQFLEPIVIDHGQGNIEVRDGHIATDPRFIPTNSEVLLLVRIQGKDRILRVKATDIGGAIKGKHVDLPIHVGPDAKPLPDTRLPKQHIRNPTVRILQLKKPASPNRKA